MKFSKFETCLITANILIGFIFFVMDGVTNWLNILGFIASISNTLCVILVAKKQISNFIWGIIGTSTYGIVSFNYANTGEWTLNLLYYLPANFIGWYFWRKTSDNKAVKTRGLTKPQAAIVYTITALLTISFGYIISLPSIQVWFYGSVFGFPIYKYFVDSLSTILSIVAMLLMIRRYKEQWILWIIVNIASIILWLITFNPLMIVLWTTLLINSVYGYIKWRKVDV